MTWLAVSEILRNFGLVLGGTIGGAIGLFLAWKRATASTRQADAALRQAELALQQGQLARRVHVAELFNRAVSQLTHEKLKVKLGAIYTLRQIASDFSDLAEPTLALLATYLRQSSVDYGDREPPVDVREIMSILKDRSAAQ